MCIFEIHFNIEHNMVLLRSAFVFFIFHMEIVSSTTGCGKLQPADIGFLMDESGSVGSENFQKNLQFVNKFVDLFNIGINEVKISAFAFHSVMGDGFHFSCCNDKTSIKNHVNSINYASGGQDFEKALAFARNSMFQKSNGARDSALKILFFFTDGRSWQVITEGALLRQHGILVYAVGVGNGVLISQLNQIAFSSSYVYNITDYSALIGSVFNTLISKTCDEIVPNACNRTISPCKHGDCIWTGVNYTCLCDDGYTGKNCEIDIDYCVGVECHHGGTCFDGLIDYICRCAERFTGTHCEIDLCVPFPADVVIVIDSSTSLGEKYFNITKDSIKKLTKEWTISPTHFQIAVNSSAENVVEEIKFDDSMNKAKFYNLVTNLKLRGGISEIQHGVAEAKHILINRNRNIDHTPVRKFVILLSDGLPSTPSKIYNQAGVGIDMFAVAIGEDVSHYWLSRLVGSIRSVYPYNNDNLWNYMIYTLVDPSCNVCQVSEENDLIFAVDTSNSSTHTDLTSTIPSILNKLLSRITLGLFKTKVSMMTFSAKPKIIFDFNEFNETNKNDMQRQLSFFTQSSETAANMNALLHEVSKLIHNVLKGARTLAKKKLVIISGFNEHLSLEETITINNLKSEGVEIFTVGLHDADDEFHVMSHMASTAFHIGNNGGLIFNSIDTFVSSFHEQLQTLTCKLE